jgi:putative endonuclease
MVRGVFLGRNGRRYTGAARDLRERMRDHHAGRAERTKNQRPLLLLHLEPLPTYADALRRERFLKSGQGRQFLDAQQTVPPEAGSP